MRVQGTSRSVLDEQYIQQKAKLTRLHDLVHWYKTASLDEIADARNPKLASPEESEKFWASLDKP